MIRLGKTKVICGIKAELVKPDADSPNSGSLNVNFEYSSVSSPSARSGPPNEKAQSISLFLNNILNSVADKKQLGIKPDEVAWAIFLDIYCLEGIYKQ